MRNRGRPVRRLLWLAALLVLAWPAGAQRERAGAELWDAVATRQWERVRDAVAGRMGMEPPDAVAEWLGGHAALYLGNYDAAEEAFRRVGTGGRPDLLQRWAESLIAEKGETPAGLVLLGDALARAGRTAEAATAFDRATARAPEWAAAYNARGALHTLRGELEAAKADFSTAIGLDQGFADAYANRGLVYLASNDAGKAVEDLSRAVERRHPVAEHARGIAFAEMGRFELAMQDLDSSQQRLRGQEWAQRNRQRVESARVMTAGVLDTERTAAVRQPASGPASGDSIAWMMQTRERNLLAQRQISATQAFVSRGGSGAVYANLSTPLGQFAGALENAGGAASALPDALKVFQAGLSGNDARRLGRAIGGTSAFAERLGAYPDFAAAGLRDFADGAAGGYNPFRDENLARSHLLEQAGGYGLGKLTSGVADAAYRGRLSSGWRQAGSLASGLTATARVTGTLLGGGPTDRDLMRDVGVAAYQLHMWDARVAAGGRMIGATAGRTSSMLAGAPELLSLSGSRIERWGKPFNVQEWEDATDAGVAMAFHGLGFSLTGNVGVAAGFSELGKLTARGLRAWYYPVFERAAMAPARKQLEAVNQSLLARGMPPMTMTQLTADSRPAPVVRSRATSESYRVTTTAGVTTITPLARGEQREEVAPRVAVNPLPARVDEPKRMPMPEPVRRQIMPPSRTEMLVSFCPGGGSPPCFGGGGGGRPTGFCPGGGPPPCFGGGGGSSPIVPPKSPMIPQTPSSFARQPVQVMPQRVAPMRAPGSLTLPTQAMMRPQGVLMGVQLVHRKVANFSAMFAGGDSGGGSPDDGSLYVPMLLYSGLELDR